MRFIVPLIASFIVAASGASLPVDDQDREMPSFLDNSPKADFWRARTAFNSKLLGALDTKSNGKNIVVSPFGIHSALSAVLAGAEGETFNQLWKALGYDYTKLNRTSMLDINQETFKNVTELQHLGLDFSNLLVVDEKLKLQPEFQQAMSNKFRSGVLQENFRTNAHKATQDVNDFVDKVTQGKIHKLFDQDLSADTAAIIVNALHLKSSWRHPFDKALTKKSTFTKFDGTQKQVDFMTIKAHKLRGARYSQNYGFDNVQIPLDNEGRLWFGIMLPNYGSKTFKYCTSFTEYIHATHGAHVDLTFPKFDISTTHSGLKELFQGLGVTDLFSASASDLSRIDGKKDLFVSGIAHKAVVTVDEAGVEAAAATGIVFETTSAVMPIKNAIPFVVDRPFIFSISDRVTGVDFFTGLVYDP